MKKYNLFSIIALVATCVLISCEKDELINITPSNVTLEQNVSNRVQQSATQTATLSYNSELTKEWWKYVLSFNCETNPLNFTSIPSSPVRQGGVVFLVGAKNGSGIRNLSVTRAQLLVVPVINTLSKYPCASFATVPGSNLTLEQLLQASADKFIDQATNFKVLLDGAPIKITHANRYSTNAFSVRGQSDLSSCIDECINGEQQTVVSDGYWLFLKGLSKGQHVLTVHAEILQTGIVIDVKYIINVI